MTQWFAFSCRANVTVEAAEALSERFGCDAFAVMHTPSRRLPRSNVRILGESYCVLPSYVFAGFESTPNFVRIERHKEGTNKRVWPVPFNGQV